MELSSLNLLEKDTTKMEELQNVNAFSYPFKDGDKHKPLTWEQALALFEQFGPNTIEQQRDDKWYKILLGTVVHPFNILLAILAVIAGATGDYVTVTFMLVMILLGTGLRFIQEMKSERAARALKNLVHNKVTVIRQHRVPESRDPNWYDVEKMNRKCGYDYEIDILEVVPGDLVKLSAGDMIPGDVKLIESKDLFISQSALTGEAIPVEKFVVKEEDSSEIKEDPSGIKSKLERPDTCFMGTSVVSGTAIAVVENTGLQTVFGEMAKEMAKKKPQHAFYKDIKRVSWMFMGIMGAMGPVVFLISGLLHKGWIESLLFAVAVCVGLTPAMLPMIVNANLARGALVMAKKRTIIKRLEAIINFGAMDVLCTDKTGTLTQNQVVLLKHIDIEGHNANLPLEMAFLNSFFQTGLKNLLDVAVIDFYTQKVDPDHHLTSRFVKVDEIPFDFVRRRMSVILERSDGEEKAQMIISKGAAEEMLKSCSQIEYSDGKKSPMTEVALAELTKMTAELNEDGLRIVGVGYKYLHKDEEEKTRERDLTFVGFIAFLDPPKETTAPAIQELIQKKITVKVLTGDSPLVCKKVCDQVKLPVTGIVTSADIQGTSDEELEILAEGATIFAKLAPLEKARVVKILKKKHVVGFLGDGINDAPALREADVGISVDSAVDVAKEAAEIILLEKSLLVLVKGVVLGRVTYGNTMKYLKMAVSSNFGNVFSVTIASAWLPFLPMLPVQLLLQNLLYDFSQLAIPWDKCDPDFLMTPKRWTAKGIMRFMVCIGPLSSIFDITTFILMYYYYGCQTSDQQTLFQSAWFVEGLLTQTLIVHMIRSSKMPVFQTSASLPVIIGTVLCCTCAVVIPFVPYLNSYLSLQPLPGMYFAYLVGANIGYMLITQLGKIIYIRVFNEWM